MLLTLCLIIVIIKIWPKDYILQPNGKFCVFRLKTKEKTEYFWSNKPDCLLAVDHFEKRGGELAVTGWLDKFDYLDVLPNWRTYGK